MSKRLRQTVSLVGLQINVLIIVWMRLADIKELILRHAIILSAILIILGLYCISPWGLFEWASTRRVLEHMSYDRYRVRSLKRHIITEKRRYAELKLEFDKLHVGHSLLKSDIEDLREQKQLLVKKHLKARSLTNSLMSQMYSLAKVLEAERADLSRQKMRLRLSLSLGLGFFQYMILAGKRIRFLSAGTSIQQERLSTLLFGHLALRSRYLNLMDICVEARQMVKKLKQDLQDEVSAREKLHGEYEKILNEVQTTKKDSRFYQALAWTVVARYDSLQTDYGQLLTSTDRLKTDYCSFQDNLREVASIVQATQDVAQVGLNDLQRATVLRPLKVKRDLMKIGQGLDLVRLNITELLVDVGLVANREVGKTFVVSTSPSPFVPGSVEDAVRKLKAMYEASLQGGNAKSDGLSDDDEAQELSLASISSVSSNDTPAIHAMMSLKGIISRIENGDVRETLLKDLTSASDIVDKIQQLVDESKDILEVQNSVQRPREGTNERCPKMVA